jgi:hypothetical protein
MLKYGFFIAAAGGKTDKFLREAWLSWSRAKRIMKANTLLM